MLRLLKCPTSSATYDVIIVGSGLSGCMVASRVLAKKPSARIAIIEEGGLPAKGLFAEAPFLATYIPLLPWTRHTCAPNSRYHGKVVGGSCAIAAGPMFVRGSADEYAAIASETGSKTIMNFDTYYAQSMAEVLPANRVVTAAMRKQSAGKIPLVYANLTQLNGDVNSRFQQSCLAANLRPITGVDSDCDGFSPALSMSANGRRFSPTDLIRDYNVDLYSETFAQRLSFEGSTTRANGVVVRPAGGSKGALTLNASQVVLCAGGVGTPSLLLRSGVGPQQALGGRSGCRFDSPLLGQSVIETPQIQVGFKCRTQTLTKSVNVYNAKQLKRAYQEFKEDGAGALAFYAEWQAFVRGADDMSLPNCRLTLCNAFANGLFSYTDDGFTVSVDMTNPHERGKIVPLLRDEDSGTRVEDLEVSYQYSYCGTEASLDALDEGVLWTTMLCDSSSNLKYSLIDDHPFKEYSTAAAAEDLAAPETTREYIRATAIGSGDVYGSCPMGSVVDADTLAVKGLSNVCVGDVSVIPLPMMANKYALGQVTACMASEAL